MIGIPTIHLTDKELDGLVECLQDYMGVNKLTKKDTPILYKAFIKLAAKQKSVGGTNIYYYGPGGKGRK